MGILKRFRRGLVERRKAAAKRMLMTQMCCPTHEVVIARKTITKQEWQAVRAMYAQAVLWRMLRDDVFVASCSPDTDGSIDRAVLQKRLVEVGCPACWIGDGHDEVMAEAREEYRRARAGEPPVASWSQRRRS